MLQMLVGIVNTIEFVNLLQLLGNAQDFGDLTRTTASPQQQSLLQPEQLFLCVVPLPL